MGAATRRPRARRGRGQLSSLKMMPHWHCDRDSGSVTVLLPVAAGGPAGRAATLTVAGPGPGGPGAAASVTPAASHCH